MVKGKMKRRAAGTQFRKALPTLPVPGKQHATEEEIQPGPSSAMEMQSTWKVESQRQPNLRSRDNLQKTDNTEHLGNRVINLNCLVEMLNVVMQAHQNLPDHCETINLVIHKERKVGLGSDLQFACQSCSFVSQTMKTYTPCAGKKQGAAINMLLASALQDTSIGVEKANVLLSSMDIPPPARSHLQNLANVAASATVDLNEADMATKRQVVISHNRDRGSANPYQMDMSFDCRYNANRLTSSYKPGQAASQAYGVAIENHTSFKYIVGLAVENKLCWTGACLRNKGFNVKCPDGHSGCTANTGYMQPHSERRMAYDLASKLNEDNIMLRTFTTDGDTRSYLGMQDFYDQLGTAWNDTRQADPNHLGSSQIRRVRKASWSADMFPGKITRQERQAATAAFSKDVKARCSKINDKLRRDGGGDITKKLEHLPDVCAATVECFSGNCSFCPHKSLVCSGTGGLGDWWFHSEFLPTHSIHRLQMTENDKELLHAILEIRLSERAVYSVSSNTSTQKCEAFNRGVLSCLPKEINHSRNFAGRLASKTLQLNNSLQSAVEAKVKRITGGTLSGGSRQYLKTYSTRADRRKRAQKSGVFKSTRRRNRARLEHDYHTARSGPASNAADEYVKGQLDVL